MVVNFQTEPFGWLIALLAIIGAIYITPHAVKYGIVGLRRGAGNAWLIIASAFPKPKPTKVTRGQ